MTELLRELRTRGIRLRVEGEGLAFSAPKGSMTAELLREIRAHRDELLDWLRFGSGEVMDADRLLARAMEAEGTSELGPDGAALKEGLSVFVESCEADARLSGLGRAYVVERLVLTPLRSRLRLASRPGPARPTRAPLIVCGLPRSGTTLLHRLLALAEDTAALPLWQLLEPLPPRQGPDLRQQHAARNLAWLAGLVSVSLDAQHYVRPELPDECAYLLRTAFLGSMPWQAPALRWLRWSLSADALPAYRVWAAFLAMLEPQDGARWVLKDPFHAAYADEIEATCPGAVLVCTHRDPLQVLPSFHKLCKTMHTALAPEFDASAAVALQTDWLEWMVTRMQRASRRIDIDYRTLAADPVATVAHIHATLGLPLSDEHVQRMVTWLSENGQRRHGENPYRCEDFGQRPEQLAERFRAYRALHGFDQ